VIDTRISRAVADKLTGLLQGPLPPSVLYHYTTASGLTGILKKNDHALWASAVGFSNDISEGRYATELGIEAIDHHPLREDKTKGWKKVFEFARSLFSEHRDWESTYLVSFCEQDNVLGQWRAYGGAASFSIGFRGLSINDLTCPTSSKILIVKIEYDAEKQKTRLGEALSSVHEFLRKEELQDLPNKDRAGLARVMLYLYIVKWACSVKQEAFRGEQEWRLVVLPPWDRSAGAYTGLGIPLITLGSPPDVREHRGTLLPYVVIKPTAGKFDIQSITVGPSNSQALEARAVKILVNKTGLEDVQVVLSGIPLRC
jgi:DUF2971 family protein